MGKILNTYLNKQPTEKIYKGEGQYLITNKRKKYLDLTGGGTSNCILGFNHPKVLQTINSQAKKISNIDYKDWIDDNRIKLSNLLTAKSTKNLNRVFFSGQSGAEACEAALMLSYQYFYEKGFKNKEIFISRNESYHGISILAQTAGDRKHLKYLSKLYPQKNIKIRPHDPLHEKKIKETNYDYLNRSINIFKDKIKKIGSERIFAFIGEPIMGQLQGDIPPISGYWKQIKHICKKNNIHLIMDEIYTGTGICGKYNCFSWDDFEPDFLLIGKTLGAGYIPLSAVLHNSKIETVIKNNSGRVSYSTTHQGHSLGVAAALAVQKVICSNNNIEHAKKLGEYLMKNLRNQLKQIELIKSIHGRGLRFSVEYNTNDNESFSDLLYKRMKNKHSILLDIKWHRIGFRPSFLINYTTANFVIEKVAKEVIELSKKFKPKKNTWHH